MARWYDNMYHVTTNLILWYRIWHDTWYDRTAEHAAEAWRIFCHLVSDYKLEPIRLMLVLLWHGVIQQGLYHKCDNQCVRKSHITIAGIWRVLFQHHFSAVETIAFQLNSTTVTMPKGLPNPPHIFEQVWLMVFKYLWPWKCNSCLRSWNPIWDYM